MNVHPPELRRAWILWFEVIENLGDRRLVRKRLTPAQYQSLHNDVISACRLYETDPDHQVARTAREIESFVGPWINLDVLCGTEGKLIRDLVREGDTKFGRHHRPPGLDFLALLKILKILKILIVAGLVTSTILYWLKPDMFTAIFDWSGENWRAVLRFTQTSRKTFYVLVVLFAVAMAYHLNFARRY